MSREADELAIRQLAAAYADAANRRSPEDMAAVYAPDGEVLAYHRSSKPIKGRDKILKACTNLMKDRDFLFILNLSGVVDIQGDVAKDRWWFAEIKKASGDNKYLFKLGTYQGEASRLDVGWRYSRRFVKSDLFNLDFDVQGAHTELPPFLLMSILPEPK